MFVWVKKGKLIDVYYNDRHKKIFYALNRKIYHFYMLFILKFTKGEYTYFYIDICACVICLLFILEIYRGVCLKYDVKNNKEFILIRLIKLYY